MRALISLFLQNLIFSRIQQYSFFFHFYLKGSEVADKLKLPLNPSPHTTSFYLEVLGALKIAPQPMARPSDMKSQVEARHQDFEMDVDGLRGN